MSGYVQCIIGKMSSFYTIISHNCGCSEIENMSTSFFEILLVIDHIMGFPHELEGGGDLVSGYAQCIIWKMSSFDTTIGHNCGRRKIVNMLTSSFEILLVIDHTVSFSHQI